MLTSEIIITHHSTRPCGGGISKDILLNLKQQADIYLFQDKLTKWYHVHHRNLPWRESHDPYHIWISEVMLQQTQVKTVIPYFLNFINRFPTLHDLAKSDLETVLKMWEGFGYYARARNFHKAANVISKNLNGTIPDNFYRFKKLPGVGDYIGAAVQSIAFGYPMRVKTKKVPTYHICNHFCIFSRDRIS
ncbi:MAG: hypothetical protein K8S13_24725 [Desulfobacula sp.]|uniref:hypothetical protein n=1 Tax=Desulfobacula sp. TaxID=2593537 RepID=UPI0025C4AAAD|nr:hypothetical protein [Desulfobacula sp.]MCD4723035.1 hypothetical protein [Desulfobacula sp.]